MNRPTKLRRLVGRYRLFWGFCPECNSDAPKLYDCRICDAYGTSRQGYPVPEGTKRTWWARFLADRCEHNVPILRGIYCRECSEWFSTAMKAPDLSKVRKA